MEQIGTGKLKETMVVLNRVMLDDNVKLNNK